MAKGHDRKVSKTSTDAEEEGEAGVRVVGYLGRLVGEPRVTPWAPADETAFSGYPGPRSALVQVVCQRRRAESH